MARNANKMNWRIVPSCCRLCPELSPGCSTEAGRHLTWLHHTMTGLVWHGYSGARPPLPMFLILLFLWDIFLGQVAAPFKTVGHSPLYLSLYGFPSCSVPQSLGRVRAYPPSAPCQGPGYPPFYCPWVVLGSLQALPTQLPLWKV